MYLPPEVIKELVRPRVVTVKDATSEKFSARKDIYHRLNNILSKIILHSLYYPTFLVNFIMMCADYVVVSDSYLGVSCKRQITEKNLKLLVLTSW